VACQATGLPLDHGINVLPYGRFPFIVIVVIIIIIIIIPNYKYECSAPPAVNFRKPNQHHKSD